MLLLFLIEERYPCILAGRCCVFDLDACVNYHNVPKKCCNLAIYVSNLPQTIPVHFSKEKMMPLLTNGDPD